MCVDHTAKIEQLIYQGNFPEAQQQIQQLPILDQLMLQSKLHEKFGEFQLAEEHARRAVALAQSLSDVIKAKVALLYALWRQGRYSTCHSLIATLPDVFPDSTTTAKLYNIIGLIYWSEAKYKSLQTVSTAINFHQKSLQLRMHLQDTVGMSFSYNNLGNAYLLLGEYVTALDYYQQALTIREDLQLTAEVATTLRDIGRLYQQKKDYAKALTFYTQAMQLREQIDNSFELQKIKASIDSLRTFL